MWRNHLALHGIVMIWGFTAILGELISLDAASIVWYRVAIAALGLLAYAWVKGYTRWPERRLVLQFLATGVLVGTHWFFFFQSVKVSSSSLAALCMSPTPFMTIFVQALFLGLRVRWVEIALSLVAVAGVFLFIQAEIDQWLGIVYGLLGAFFASLFSVLNGVFIKKSRGHTIALYEMMGAVFALTIAELLIMTGGQGLGVPAGTDWVYLLLLGLVCTSLPFVVATNILRVFTPYTVSLSINMEPIYTILLALLIFGQEQVMSLGAYLGGGLILLTVVLQGLLNSPMATRWRSARAAERAVGRA